ncbi:MAG TPA: translation initiation factor eIF-1A [Candidatus Poseidoniales archaeon]|nr:MAG TPA: translation initiation factor eIF-1A [Candidatus Poseidoniales archaeon]HIH81937.1 translation initiation factor eIF-1A [Candidatus Thalassarchaeaceae archaeon]|tara:strand:- start:6045 stop:6644 length:600 start_codon:yes stop_codon:yes gene_type:complete
MGRRREETVDEELLAQLEGGSGDKIRVPLPNERINEMFAIADQILGGRRVRVVCADGETRLARIPGKMRRRQWVREGDLIVVQPWDFQDSKADVKKRYSKTQSLYLSRKGVLPEIVDVFGTGTEAWDDLDDAGIFGEDISSEPEIVEDDFEEEADDVEDSTDEEEMAEAEPVAASPAEEAEPFDDDVTDDDIDSLFGPA